MVQSIHSYRKFFAMLSPFTLAGSYRQPSAATSLPEGSSATPTIFCLCRRAGKTPLLRCFHKFSRTRIAPTTLAKTISRAISSFPCRGHFSLPAYKNCLLPMQKATLLLPSYLLPITSYLKHYLLPKKSTLSGAFFKIRR